MTPQEQAAAKPYRIEMLRRLGRGVRWMLIGPGVEKSFDSKDAAQVYADQKWPEHNPNLVSCDPPLYTPDSVTKCNLATIRTLVRAFEPVATPEFMRKLRDLVEENEAEVRKEPKRAQCPDCKKMIAWPIRNPAGPFCPECGGLINIVSKPTERAPLLSDKEMYNMPCHTESILDKEQVRRWYEAKISSGELITKEEHERLLQEARENPPMPIDPTSGR